MIENKSTQIKFLLGLLNFIQVDSVIRKNRDNEDSQIGHFLVYNFKMRIIEDKLIYKDEKKKFRI